MSATPAAATPAATTPVSSALTPAAHGTSAADQGMRMKLFMSAHPTFAKRPGKRLDVSSKSKQNPPTVVPTTPVKGSLCKLSPTRYNVTVSPDDTSPVVYDSSLRMRMLKQNLGRVSLVQIPARLFPCPTSNLSPEARTKVSELVKMVGSGRNY